MDSRKRKRLEKAGWKVGDAEEFLEMGTETIKTSGRKVKLRELKVMETSRIYIWNEDIGVLLKGITHFKKVGEEHRLRTLDGKLHVIPDGWVHLEIDSKEFQF